MRIVGVRSERLVLRDGIVGYRTIRPRCSETSLQFGDTLLLYSDGIRAHFDLPEYPTLFSRTRKRLPTRF